MVGENSQYPKLDRVSDPGTSDNPNYTGFFFYQCEQFDPTDRYVLGMRVHCQNRDVRPADRGEIGLVDLRDGYKWTHIGETTAWNWQQGARLQWRPGSDEILWNDRSDDGTRYICRVYNFKTGARRTLPRPIYTPSPDGTTALTHDFERMKHGGTPYVGIEDKYASQYAPKETGIWRMDLNTGEATLIMGLEKMARIAYPEEPPSSGCLYIFREGWNPSGSRFIAFLKDPDNKFDKAFSMTPDGTDVRYFYNLPSHHEWRDDRCILDGRGYYLYEDDGTGKAKGRLFESSYNGHVSYIPRPGGDWIISDTYAIEGWQYLFLYHLPTKRFVPLARLKSTAPTNVYRVDLHPRLSRDRRMVCIDATHEGLGRQMYVLDIGHILDNPPGQALDIEQWTAKIHAGWVGKVSAGSGALTTEMWPKERIRQAFGVLDAPPKPPTPRGPLDDTTLAFLGWHAAREHGPDFTTSHIAQELVDHLTDADLQGGGFGKEFLDALARLRRGERPPIVSGSPRAEWIAAQMRAEIWGMLAPGDPARAADYAARDAKIFNIGNGIYAAQFVAVLASQLMTDPNVPRAIAIARQYVPADAILARLIDDVIRWHREEPNDWEKTWQSFVDLYRDRSLEAQFAAWSPDWLVETGGWPEAEVLAEYRGRKGVLRSHPFSDTEPACLTTEMAVPPSGGSLTLEATCNDTPANVDWLLRVRIGEAVQEHPIRWANGQPQWQDFNFDLKPWAGQRVTIVLENAVLGKQAWEAGFWTAPQLRDAKGQPLHGSAPAGRPYRYPVDFTPKILPETFSVLVGLLYGEGDFRKSVSVATMCGFDTDCNAGTVGCLLGLRNGLDAIPAEWKDPLGGMYELQVAGLPRQWKIIDLAAEMARTGLTLAGQNPR
jgi:ADP-ribosylglycohydrolase